MREAVWRRLDRRFDAGDSLLEVNCGTGEDAVHFARRGVRVLATDISPAMVEVAREKVRAAGLEASVAVRRLGLEQLDELSHEPFDGALSNFGGLNCVADLGAVSHGLAARLRPGAILALCVMGPLVPWEWLWFLLRGRPGKAFRRLRPGGVEWRGLQIRYPPIGRVRRSFAGQFRALRATAVGAFLPPSYAEDWAARHPAWLDRLDRWERRFESWPPLPQLADHYLLELERR